TYAKTLKGFGFNCASSSCIVIVSGPLRAKAFAFVASAVRAALVDAHEPTPESVSVIDLGCRVAGMGPPRLSTGATRPEHVPAIFAFGTAVEPRSVINAADNFTRWVWSVNPRFVVSTPL